MTPVSARMKRVPESDRAAVVAHDAEPEGQLAERSPAGGGLDRGRQHDDADHDARDHDRAEGGLVDGEPRERQQQRHDEEQREEHVDRRAGGPDEGARRPHVERDGLAGDQPLVVEPGDPAPGGGRGGHG